VNITFNVFIQCLKTLYVFLSSFERLYFYLNIFFTITSNMRFPSLSWSIDYLADNEQSSLRKSFKMAAVNIAVYLPASQPLTV